MKRVKSEYLLIIVSIVLLVTILIGTSFAYFAVDTNNINVTNVQVNVGQSSAMITTTSTQCSMNVDISMMGESMQNLITPVGNDSCNLVITLSGDPGMTCSYDLVLHEENTTINENYVAYVPTNGLGVDYNYEFTATITNTFSENTYINVLEEVSYYNDGTNDIDAIGNEIQLNILESQLYRQNTQDLSNGVIAHGVIGITQDNVPSTHTYQITEKWYNINKNQENHKGKQYIYYLSAENVIC